MVNEGKFAEPKSGDVCKGYKITQGKMIAVGTKGETEQKFCELTREMKKY